MTSPNWQPEQKRTFALTRIAYTLIASLLLVAILVSCGGGTEEPPTPTPRAEVIVRVPPTPTQIPTLSPIQTPAPLPTPTQVPEPTPSPEPTPEPEPTPTPRPYDSTTVMYDLAPPFAAGSDALLRVIQEIRDNNDSSLVPVLVEIMRFLPTRALLEGVGETLRTLSGQSLEDLAWDKWMEWLGQNLADYQPPPEYAAWKSAMYANLHPRFAMFLEPASEFSRIDVTEIVWGGVLPDGIPDLRDPEFLTPDEADYILPDDRIFGVEINGEVRAYPLRIVNAHEMVNDTVGGEPISLMW